MEREEIFAAIRPLLADSLALKQERVTLESRLVDDLGADSLDFIDVLFGLEKRFGIKVRDGEFDFLARLDLSSPDVMRHGFLTRQTVEDLKASLPALSGVADPEKVTPRQLFSFITVETLCVLVQRKLEA